MIMNNKFLAKKEGKSCEESKGNIQTHKKVYIKAHNIGTCLQSKGREVSNSVSVSTRKLFLPDDDIDCIK